MSKLTTYVNQNKIKLEANFDREVLLSFSQCERALKEHLSKEVNREKIKMLSLTKRTTRTKKGLRTALISIWTY